MRIRSRAGVVATLASVMIMVPAGVPVAGAAPAGPGVRLVLASPGLPDEEDEEDEEEGQVKVEAEASSDRNDGPGAPRTRVPVEPSPPDAARGQSTSAPTPPPPSAVPPPTVTAPVPLPPVATPPGWDPVAEAAKWREVERRLREEPHSRPDPRIVESFASALSGERRGRGRPTRSVPVAADIDGCDRAYGTASQCIPVTLPPGVPDLCAYLAGRGFPPIRVNGADPARLDPDGNRVACD